MKLTNFFLKCGSSQYDSEILLKRDVDERWGYINPIVNGVASTEEVEHASLKELQLLNALADRKRDDFANAIAYALAKVMYPE